MTISNSGKIRIINTGGTFNKVYNKLNGELYVPTNDDVVEDILSSYIKDNKIKTTGIVYKDSLEINQEDRDKIIAEILVNTSKDEQIVIIHGTDTMHITAANINKINTNKVVVITGAMQPYSIDNIEPTLNLGMAIGFAKACTEHGVYICMSGEIVRHDLIKKDLNKGEFKTLNNKGVIISFSIKGLYYEYDQLGKLFKKFDIQYKTCVLKDDIITIDFVDNDNYLLAFQEACVIPMEHDIH